MRASEGLDDASFSIGNGRRLLLVVLVLLLFGVSALARFGVLAVGRAVWDGLAMWLEDNGNRWERTSCHCPAPPWAWRGMARAP